MRYIDADKLLNPDNIIVMQDETGIDEFPYTYTNAVKVETILNAPTVDVVEVRHGEWRIVDSDIGYVELECSLCRNKLLFNTDDGFTYCPNCGAYMRGTNDGEE